MGTLLAYYALRTVIICAHNKKVKTCITQRKDNSTYVEEMGTTNSVRQCCALDNQPWQQNNSEGMLDTEILENAHKIADNSVVQHHPRRTQAICGNYVPP